MRDDFYDGDEIFHTPEAGDYVKHSSSTMEKLRVRGGGPVYSKPTRRVIYRRRDLDDWLASKRRRSTSDAAPIKGDF